MQITRNSIQTPPGPSDWFTGAVYIDTVAAPSNGSRLSASSVHFTLGARTAWLLEVGDDGGPATWGDHVTDEEYAAAPSQET